jgi:hypothetical protein
VILPPAELSAHRSKLRLAGSIYESIHRDSFFDGQDQFFSDIHFPTRLDSDAQIGEGFADDAARHGDMALSDDDEQNHWFTEPRGVHWRKILCSLGNHVGLHYAFREA